MIRFSAYNKNYGYSLIEVSIILVLVSYTVYLSIGYFQDLKVNQQIQNITNRLESLLIYSRNQAILTNESITVCSTIDNKTCYTKKSGKNYEWKLNWMVYVGTKNNEINDDANKILYISINKAKFIQIHYNKGDTITFNNMGRCSNYGSFTVNYDDGTSTQSYKLIISTAGRIRQEH